MYLKMNKYYFFHKIDKILSWNFKLRKYFDYQTTQTYKKVQ